MSPGPRPRAGLLLPFWDFWTHTVPYDVRAERERMAARVEAMLGESIEVAAVATADSTESAAALADRWADLDAILVLQTMAVPPAYACALLERLPEVGVVVWGADRGTPVGEDFDHASITAEGTTVGVPMLLATLVRAGRPADLVFGPIDDPASGGRVLEALRRAASAARVRRARVGSVGGPQPGYVHVGLDPAALAAKVGPTVVEIEPAELRDLYVEVAAERVDALEAETRAAWEVDGGVGEDGMRRSLRAALAIEDLVDRHRLDAGALNCHLPEIRLGETIGIAPCFGLGRSTSRGVPWTCAGDLVTAIAMLCLKALGAPTLYHELEALDRGRGEFVVANTGEHDLGLATGGRPSLVENGWFCDDPHRGACACFALPAGTATLAGFVQLDDPSPSFRLIAAGGELSGRGWPGVGTPNGGFRFSDRTPPAAWERWCLAGATHHSALAPGDMVADLEALARLLSLEFVRVS